MTAKSSEQVVAVCQGHRCRALLSLQQPPGLPALREAVRRSRSSVLVSTGCLGPCAHGPVVAVGSGRHAGGALVLTPQALLGPVDAGSVAALGRHLSATGPDAPPAAAGAPPAAADTLPAELDPVRLRPPAAPGASGRRGRTGSR
jgi:hypothetical protein